MKTVTVKLQEGMIYVETDADRRVRPSRFWKELMRVGFVPADMDLWATGSFDSNSFEIDGAHWPLQNAGPAAAGRRRAHLKVVNGGDDPLRVRFLD